MRWHATVHGLRYAPAGGKLGYKTLYDPSSLCCELCNKSKNWVKIKPKLLAVRGSLLARQSAAAAALGEEVKYAVDHQHFMGNCIMVESIAGSSAATWKEDLRPFNAFQAELLQALSANLP